MQIERRSGTGLSRPMLPVDVRMIRCSTLLIHWARFNILTDPWFGMTMRGLRCYRAPGMRPSELPPLDGVLVSHIHPDHFERGPLDEMRPQPGAVLFPPGALAKLAQPHGPGWAELPPWRTAPIGRVEVTAVPARHTGPGPDEVNYVMCFPGWGCGFFGGDARLDEDVLRQVRERFGPMSFALLPVGGSRILGRKTVMDAADAARAGAILEAKAIVPIHEGGIWMAVPPLSRHPGRAAHLGPEVRKIGSASRVVVLKEGEAAALAP
ncbi:MAG: MBL fold metallo-hydrolase [Deltaproteobacteria bacterium]|nr:MBL fold metallo-hydrolase [Deltaproteobacteria bacterium]